MRESPATQLLPHAVAAGLTAVMLTLGAWVLLWKPPPRPVPGAGEFRLQLRLVARDETPGSPLPAAPGRALHAAAAPAAAAVAGMARPVAEAARPAGTPVRPAAPAGQGLYGEDGSIRLPEGALAGATAPASDPMQRPDPVGYRATRFEGDWVSDGSVGEVAAQAIARGQRKVAELVLGKDIQHARARPPPEVRFNPARHERPQDLGSEATGDAWRAAPISAEPVPGLDGRASRSIRQQVAQLEREHARCPRPQLEELMVPVRQALDQLQAAEHALAKGADPIRARHQLPNAANSAWDQARRGLWHARHKLAGCRG